jgi:hypothetical protein
MSQRAVGIEFVAARSLRAHSRTVVLGGRKYRRGAKRPACSLRHRNPTSRFRVFKSAGEDWPAAYHVVQASHFPEYDANGGSAKRWLLLAMPSRRKLAQAGPCTSSCKVQVGARDELQARHKSWGLNAVKFRLRGNTCADSQVFGVLTGSVSLSDDDKWPSRWRRENPSIAPSR